MHTAIKRGIGWGALIGGVAGAAIITAQCGTNWSERSGCGNLNGIWLVLGPALGLGIGSAVGANHTVFTVIYRAP